MKKLILIIVGIIAGVMLCGFLSLMLLIRGFMTYKNNSPVDGMISPVTFGTTTPTPSTGNISEDLEICSLLTEAEATQLLKQAVTKTIGTDNSTCSYETKDAKKTGLIGFSINRSSSPASAADLEPAITEAYKDNLVLTTGYKNAKVYITKDSSAALVLKANAWIVIRTSSTAYKNNNELLTIVITKILSRL